MAEGLNEVDHLFYVFLLLLVNIRQFLVDEKLILFLH